VIYALCISVMLAQFELKVSHQIVNRFPRIQAGLRFSKGR
jgi:hypothetical protein